MGKVPFPSLEMDTRGYRQELCRCNFGPLKKTLVMYVSFVLFLCMKYTVGTELNILISAIILEVFHIVHGNHKNQ